MKNFSLVILSILALGIGVSRSPFAQADENPKYICEAGVTIPKHLQSYLGDISTSRDIAAQSAMEKCETESAFSDSCRMLSCYVEESFMNQ